MRAKFVPPDPAAMLQRAVNTVRSQPPLALASYGCAAVGARLAIHDFHHYTINRFGFSPVFVGAAIVLYVLSQRRPIKRTPPRLKR
jgi:hypothetical protein